MKTDMTPQETGFFDTIIKYGWVVISVLISLVWKQKTEEIKELQVKVSSMVTTAVYEKNRDEMRQNQVTIFNELNDVKTMLARIEGRLEKDR